MFFNAEKKCTLELFLHFSSSRFPLYANTLSISNYTFFTEKTAENFVFLFDDSPRFLTISRVIYQGKARAIGSTRIS